MLTLSLALAIQAAATPAVVPKDDTLDYDVACVSVISAAVQQNEDKAGQLMPLSTFYIGRIDARSASDDAIRTAGSAISSDFAGKDIQPVFQSCTETFRTAGARLNRIASSGADGAPAAGAR